MQAGTTDAEKLTTSPAMSLPHPMQSLTLHVWRDDTRAALRGLRIAVCVGVTHVTLMRHLHEMMMKEKTRQEDAAGTSEKLPPVDRCYFEFSYALHSNALARPHAQIPRFAL